MTFGVERLLSDELRKEATQELEQKTSPIQSAPETIQQAKDQQASRKSSKIKPAPVGRAEKIAISENCLNLLKKILGERSLEETSEELRSLNPEQFEIFRAEHKNILEKFSSQERKNFYKKVLEIREMIQAYPDHLLTDRLGRRLDASAYRKKIQRKVCKALKDPIYEALKEHEFDPLVHFLHDASDILHNRQEAGSVFAETGSRLHQGKMGPPDEDGFYTPYQLRTALEEARSNSATLSLDASFAPQPTDFAKGNNTAKAGISKASQKAAKLARALEKAGRRAWNSLRHPQRSIASLQSLSDNDRYNAYETGNINCRRGVLWLNGVPVAVGGGANPSHPDYTIYPALIQRAENYQKLGIPHAIQLHTILEGAEPPKKPGSEAAKERRDRILEMSSGSAMAFPMDGPIWEGSGPFKKVGSAKDFIRALREEREKGNNCDFIIPESLLNDEMREEVEDKFIAAWDYVKEQNPDKWEELVKSGQLCKTLLVQYNALIWLKILDGITKNLPKETHQIDGLSIQVVANAACKQGIDRTPPSSEAIRLLADAKARGSFKFTKEQLDQCCGYVTGRAPMVEGRRIFEDRYKPLPNFISLIEDLSEEQQAEFLDLLGLPDEIAFIPSFKEPPPEEDSLEQPVEVERDNKIKKDFPSSVQGGNRKQQLFDLDNNDSFSDSDSEIPNSYDENFDNISDQEFEGILSSLEQKTL